MSPTQPPEPPPADPSDPEVIAGYRKYLKKIAREKLATGYQPDLEASDLVGEVLTEMVRHQATFEQIPPRARPSWLRRVLLNRLTDYVRRAMARSHGGGRSIVTLDAGPSGTYGDALLDPQETPSRIVSRGEEEEIVRAAIAALSDLDREVILARDYDGLDFAAIGERLGLTAEAARKRHERAVRRLGTALVEAGVLGMPPSMRSA
jgi:RNA polymerase sigma factor (sigma-70 family)